MIALAVMVLKDTNVAAKSDLFRDQCGLKLYPVGALMRGLVVCEDTPMPVVTDNLMGVCCTSLLTNLGQFRKQDFESLSITEGQIQTCWEQFTPAKFKGAVKQIIESNSEYLRDHETMEAVRLLCQQAQSQMMDRRVNILYLPPTIA